MTEAPRDFDDDSPPGPEPSDLVAENRDNGESAGGPAGEATRELIQGLRNAGEGLDTPTLRRLVEELPETEPGEGIHVGSAVDGFCIRKYLGSGGMGVVYEADQLSVPGRRVALKILRDVAARNCQKRFEREIAIIGRLHHAAIVPVYHAGVFRGQAYYAMAFVEGPTLARLIADLKKTTFPPDRSGFADGLRNRGVSSEVLLSLGKAKSERQRRILAGPTALAQALRGGNSPTKGQHCQAYCDWAVLMTAQVADALDYAQRMGVVHRDVKPANILIDKYCRPVLADFGLAAAEDGEALTQTGEFLGTLVYASPEQVKKHRLDTRTDVYSLAATFYELLSSVRPFDARTQSELEQKILWEEPTSLPSWIPRDLRAVCFKGLSKKPAHRYSTPGLFADDLRRFLDRIPVDARPPTLTRKVLSLTRKYRRAILVFGVVMLGVIALILRDHKRASEALQEGLDKLSQISRKEVVLRDAYRKLYELQSNRWLEPDYTEKAELLRRKVREQREQIKEIYRDAEQTMLRSFQHIKGYFRARDELANLCAAHLRFAFFMGEDYFSGDQRQEVLALSKALEQYDDARLFRGLLETQQKVTIATQPIKASVMIYSDRRSPWNLTELPAIEEGDTPLSVRLEAGSYVAILEAQGYESCRFPFLVRRPACYDAPERTDQGTTLPVYPPRDLNVQMLPEDDSFEGFVYVPAGWTLIENDPPLWAAVDEYQMREFELTNYDYLAFVNRRLLSRYSSMDRVPESSIPRHITDGGKHLLPTSDAKSARLAPGVLGEWPLRGLGWLDFPLIDVHFDLAPPRGWYCSLPSLREWIRGARGADARKYPWGNNLTGRRIGTYWPKAPDHDLEPFEVRSISDDVSPFLIRGLATSVREASITGSSSVRDERFFFGGSFRSRSDKEFEVTYRMGEQNGPTSDGGFRLVLRRVPKSLLVAGKRGPVFRDTFDRPNGLELGHGWKSGNPDPLDRSDSESQRLPVLDAGRLVLSGGRGSFSHGCSVWRFIEVGDSDFRISVAFEMTWELADHARGVNVQLSSGFVSPDDWHGKVSLANTGQVQVLVSPVDGVLREGVPPPATTTVSPVGPMRLEIEVLKGKLNGRVWPEEEQRPEQPVTVPLDPRKPPFRFLRISADNLVEVRVLIDEVVVRALDP